MNSLQLTRLRRHSLKQIILITFLTLAISGLFVVDKGYRAFLPAPPPAAPSGLLTAVQQASPKKTDKDLSILKSWKRLNFQKSLESDLAVADSSDFQQSFQSEIVSGDSSLAEFWRFLSIESGNQADLPQGVYVQDVMQLPIVQQPIQNPVFVSNKPGVVTQYRDAARNGITGLLAHNYLSGELFNQLAIGQEVLIVYGNRTVRHYQVESVRQFQKLSPSDTQSDYLDLSDGKKLSSSQVFNEFYQGNEHVTFQTCLKEDGLWNWGVVFVVAKPLEYHEQ